MWWMLCVLVVATCAEGSELTDEEYALFPKLFHLDEYQSCLARRGGLYCLGSFQLTPRMADDATYAMMLDYSKDPLHFNRTIIHRGYCVSARCPPERAKQAERAERNETYRFEQCIGRWARSRGFQSAATAVQYCQTTEQLKASRTVEVDTPMIAFLVVVFIILLLNVIGTTYDVWKSDDGKKHPVLVSWSVRSNWRRLTAPYEERDPRAAALKPLQGVRVLVMVLVIGVHGGLLHFTFYTHNPRDLEQFLHDPILMLMRNGSSIVQVFIVMANFLLGYHLLLHSRSQELSLAMLPKGILSRLVRLTPLYLLVVAFAATWWPVLGEGPMWSAVVAGSAACRRKFWWHSLYLHNFVYPDDQCLLQTWFLAVDVQLFVVACALTLSLARRRGALWTLAALAGGSVLLNTALALRLSWTTMLHMLTAENARSLFTGVPSFKYFYIAPWGSLPASLIGLFLAFLHFHLQEKEFKMEDHKWLSFLSRWLCLPLLLTLYLTGLVTQHWREPGLLAVTLGLERPVVSLICAGYIFVMINGVQHWVSSVLSWRVWTALGRLSLAALLLHWLLIVSLLAASHRTFYHSYFSILWEWAGAVVMTYVFAAPLTLTVEMPFMRSVSALM